MPLLDLAALRAALPRHQRLIGIDPGSRTLGLALSDVSLMIASPYGSLPRGKLRAVRDEEIILTHRGLGYSVAAA